VVTADVLTLVAVATAAAAAALSGPGPRPEPLPASATAGRAVQPGGPPRERAVLQAVSTVAVGAGGLVLFGGVIGLVVGAVAGAVCWRFTRRLEPPAVRRRREQVTAAVPHIVDLMAACLAAGLSPSGAVEQIADAVDHPARDELLALSARLRLGVDPVTVWRDLAHHPQLGGLGRSVARAVESGASVSEAMTRLADDLRRAARADVESRARAVGVKAAVPLGVCLLPAFVLVGVVPLVAGSLTVLLGR
jgi:Flp pilus assembly protein TadB